MKFIHIIFLFIPIIFFSCNSDKTETDLSTAIITVVKAFNEKDTLTVNKYIHKDYGMIVLYRQGAYNRYEKIPSIDFNDPVPEDFPYTDFIFDTHLKYDQLPEFDCDQMKWNKTGLYCDSFNIDNLLSATALNIKKYVNPTIPDTEIREFEEMEKKSVRIVLSNIHGGDLVFYMTKINNNWYITILDRCSSDCSA